MTEYNAAKIKEIQERRDAATPGNWRENDRNYVFTTDVDSCEALIASCSSTILGPSQEFRNAAFIAHSWEDETYLLSLVTEQRREIERLESEVARLKVVVKYARRYEQEFSNLLGFEKTGVVMVLCALAGTLTALAMKVR